MNSSFIKSGISLLVLLSSIFAEGQPVQYLQTDTTSSITQLKKEFEKPPIESQLRCYWWWLNGMTTKATITRDLEQMKAKGYGGASLVDAGSSNYDMASKTKAGPVFLSPKWMELYQFAVKEADRLGLELSVNVQSGWNPGGPDITPDMAMKKLVYTETEVHGGQQVQVNLPQPETNLLYHDVVVQAIPMPAKDSPVKNDAIAFWDKKSFNKPMGWRGIYPLHELRDGFHNSVKVDIIHKKDIIDLTKNFDGTQLTWDAPAGDWLVIRYGWTCTGARTSTTSDGWGGLALDHLNPKAFDLFRQTVIQPLIDSAQAVGNSMKFLQTDSWEMGTVNWTNNFPEDFKHFCGYDLFDYLPVMTGRVVESQDVSNRFLHDIRQTVGDCVAEYHYQKFADLAHKYNMGIHPESGGPHSAPVDALRVMGISDYPQGEYWARANTHRVSAADRLAVKQSACVAHIYGKRLVAAEGPTSIGPQWERSPKDLKANIDRIFCSGVNQLVWHTFTSSPKEFGVPGNEYFAGTHLNPNVTWWNKAGDFISYLDRCSSMLQRGLFVADVLYYYGDDVPNFVFLKSEYPELHFGYDWDKCPKDVLLNRVSFDGEKLVLPDGMSYRILVLTPEQAMDLDVLKKVEKLVHEGLTVIGERPQEATGLTNYPESDRELKTIADHLWGNIDGKKVTENHYGKGRVIWGQDVNEVLSKMNVQPDFAFDSPDPKTALDYIHRTDEHAEIYFVVNRYARKGINDFKYRYLTDLPNRYEQVDCKFRVTGKVPQLWDPKTGEIHRVLTWREENGYTIIPLHFNPEGSIFVVFTDEQPQCHVVKIEKDGKPLFPNNSFKAKVHPFIAFDRQKGEWEADAFEPGNYTLHWSDGKTQAIHAKEKTTSIPVTGSWKVHFDPAWGGPDQVTFDSLKSWTSFADPGIKYYSGTADYQKTFKLTKKDLKGKKVLLDLGNLHELAQITINDHQFPVSWSAPFELDVTEAVHDGENRLKVEVVNLWPNRLIGDSKLPKFQRFTESNVNKFEAKDSEKYLKESGLLGPVQLLFVNKEEL